MVIGLEEKGTYFSGNMNNLAITEVNSYVDITLRVGAGYVMDKEKYYPNSTGKVVLFDFGKLIMNYFSFPDISNPADFYLIPALEVYLYCQDKTGAASRTIYACYSRSKVSQASPVAGMIYSRYKAVDTSLEREEYLTLFAGTNTVLNVGVAYLRNRQEKYTVKQINLGNRTGMVACRLSLSHIARFFGLSVNDILFYDAVATDGTDKDKVRYQIDKRSYRSITHFVYLNSLGLPETVAFNGLVDYNPELTGDMVSLLSEDIRIVPQLTDVRTVNSGYLNNEKYKAVMDMVTSTDIRVSDAGIYYRIIISEIDFQHKIPGHQRFSVTVTYRPAERYYIGFDRLRNSKNGIFDNTFDITFD